MTELSATSPLTRGAPVPRALNVATLVAGLSAAIPAVALAVIAVEATPHTRGLGFFPELRYALVTPACVVIAVAAAVLYRALAPRFVRPRLALALALFGLALLLLSSLALAGKAGLASAATPTLFSVALALTWLVPRALSRPRRSRARRALLVLFGALQAFLVVLALGSERPAPASSTGLAFEVPRAMFDVEHRFVTLSGGARVHYVDEGQGQTLLFLHGNPSWSFQWRDLIHELRGSYRCVALDYPGFGLSQAAAGYGFTAREQSYVVEEFVQRLGLRDVTLVMQDWGGPIGLGFAGRRPELVSRVVLGSTWAWPTTSAEPRGKFSVIMGGPVGEFLQMNFNGFAKLGIKNGIVRELPPGVLDVYVRPFRPIEQRGVAAFYPGQINAASDYFREVEAGLSRLNDKPALILWALRDAGFPRSDLIRFERAFPRHQTVEFPDADHFFFEDTLPQMRTMLRAFLTP